MLDQLRERASKILAGTDVCTLATTGPAGIQASMVSCAAHGMTLYLLVPDTSDHLFNLEIEREVAVTTPSWHLRGVAEVGKGGADLFAADQRQWHSAVRVTPIRLHILSPSGAANYAETIDFDPVVS